MIQILTRVVCKTQLPLNPKKFLSHFPSSLKPRTKATKMPAFNFSSSSSGSDNEKIKNALNSIQVDVKGEKKSILDSGIVSGYGFDEKISKNVVTVSLVKDFPKIRALLVRTLTGQGVKDVEVVLEQKQDKKIF